MDKRRSNRLIAGFVAVSAVLLLVSYLRSDLPDDYLSELLLQLGSTALLAPVVFVAERVMSNRLEAFRTSVRSEIRNLRERSMALSLAETWEDAHPHIERMLHLYNSAFVLVGVPDHELWLGFGTFRQFDLQTLQLRSFLAVYYEKPYDNESEAENDLLYWSEGVTLSGALDIAEEHLKNKGAISFQDHLDKSLILHNLRARLGLTPSE